MVAKILKSKKAWVVLALLLVAVTVLIVLVITNGSDNKSEIKPPTTADAKKDSFPSSTPDQQPQITAPEAKLPDTCRKGLETVKKIIGGDSRATGNSTKTKNSTLVECSYYKDDQIVNIRIYEYGSDAEAKADLSKVQIKGYASQTKGKHNGLVLVSSASGTSAESAGKILTSTMESL